MLRASGDPSGRPQAPGATPSARLSAIRIRLLVTGVNGTAFTSNAPQARGAALAQDHRR
jgi:hypothetical protein